MLELRPTTNLKSPANLILKGEAARTNFLYLYNSLFGIPPLVAYAKMCFHAFLPTVVGHKAFGADRKLMRTITSPGEKGLNLFKIPRGTMRVTKELSKNGTAPGFRVSLPMFRFSSDTALRSALMGFVNFSKLPDNELRELMSAQIASPLSDVTETQALIQAMAGFPKFQAALEATNAVLYRENHGSDTFLFLSVTVRAEEAQQLTTTPFDQIRPSDLYTVLLEWALAGYGTNAKPPKASFQITRIARTLPQSEQIKPALNSEMITLDAHGHPLMIPKVLNKTSDYDQKYFDAGIREDGSFQLISNKDTEEDLKRRKPPANMPVLVDWLNGRFAYTDTNGGLKTLDLTKCRAPNATQLVRLASKPFNEQVIKQMMGVCRAIGMPPFKPDPEALESVGIGVLRNSDLASEENILNYLNAIFPMFEARTGRQAIRYIDFGSGEFPPLNAVFKYFQEAGILALQNPESIYQTYSVIYAVTTLPYFLLVSYYGQPERFAELVSLDNEERKPYYQQKPDENWGDESLPLAGASLGQLPHQKRVRNQLRNFPKAAILPIQAGGGKTPIIIMDILKFVKAKKGFPYLIMCPSHLVAQYVSEIAFFTDGKLNPIPINTASCNTNGLKRLTQIIQSAPRNTVVIVDYDVCSRIATDRVVYGTTPVNVYHIIEFLRQFNFGYCALDEAHYLRRSSGRTEAVQRLVLDIPYKRLASGTFAHDSVSDLVSQLSLIDPTMFGTRDEFHERYALEMAGNRVRVWRPNAENEIKAEIKRNMVEARAYRKEWAALLPPAKEDLHIVTMSEAQRSAYNALVSDVMVEIKEKAKTNPLLQKWLDRKSGKAEAGEDGEDSSDVEDDIQAESLEQLLKKYLARVERFCTAMGRDDWGKLHLSGEDLVSPKINKIIEIITDHVQKGIPGKIIVFTNYVWSAEEIYAALPSNIKSRFVLYKAGNKTECMAKFEAPETIGMVGVSSSMDTGLNLQCFPGHTQVLLDKKRSLSIEEIYHNDDIQEVLAYDLENRRIEKRRIISKYRTRVKPTDRYVSVKVEDTRSGRRQNLVLTADHPVFLRDHSEVRAGDLRVGDQLITFGGKFDLMRWADDGALVRTEEFSAYQRGVSYECPECGEWHNSAAMWVHRAKAHGVDAEKFESFVSKVSKSTLERWDDPDYRARHTEANREIARNQTPEFRSEYVKRGWDRDDGSRAAAVGAATKACWKDPVHRAMRAAKISKSLLEISETLSANSKANWQNPKYVRKIEAAWDELRADPERWARYTQALSEAGKRNWADPWFASDMTRKFGEEARSPEGRARRSRASAQRHKDNPEYSRRSVQAMLNAQYRNPSSLERQIIELGIDNLEYTGSSHSRYWTSIIIDGKRVAKNPDFISLSHMNEKGRTTRVVEVIGAREWTKRDAAYDKKLIKAYKKAGIECLIIGEEEFHDLHRIEARLQSFVNNHYLRVVAVKEYTNPNVIGEYKYDLEVEGVHNYFACAGNSDLPRAFNSRGKIPVLVHNCASRLIRDGYVWNPGTLEQGDSRIGRPQLKVAETRDYIYYDTVLLNGTVDITKMCRIFSKSLSVAKYDNSDDPAYADLPSLPVVPMKFESLEEFSDARTEAVKQFYEGYSKYKYIRDADYKEFRERYSGANRLTLEPVEHAADPEDAAILEQTPYIPGYDLYGKDQLGLVRLDHYLNENINISESSELDDDIGEDDATQSELWLAEASKLVVGQLVHSQNGDGRITKIGPNTATYVTAKGVRATQRFSTLFLMKKPIKGGVRNALATITKLPLHKVDNIVGTKRQQAVKVKPPKVVAPPVSEKLSLELWPVVINGFLCLEYQPNGDDDPNINALQAVGFRRSPPYKYAQIRNHIHLLNQFKKWAEVGMTPDPKMPELNEQFQNLFVTMKAGKLKKNTSAELLRFANQTHLKNFMRMELKPNNNPEVFRPFPLIENNKAYIVLPVNGQLGTKKAMLHRVPLTKWFDGPEVLQCWTLSIQKSVQVVKSLINSGVQIANSKELERELKSLRKAPVRKDDESFYSK